MKKHKEKPRRITWCRLKYIRARIGIRLSVAPRYLSIKCRLGFALALYRFYLCRKRLLLPFHRRRVRLSLLNAEREFVAKYGCDWRLCVFDDQVVQFLEMRKYVHDVLWPNDKSSATREEKP